MGDAGKVGVGLPVREPLLQGLLRRRVFALDELRVQGQVGTQPLKRLASQCRFDFVGQGLRIFCSPRRGKDGAARGVVAILLVEVGGELRFCGESLADKADRGGVQTLRRMLAEIHKPKEFDGGRRLGIAADDSWKSAVEFDETLGVSDPLGGGIAPARPPGTQFVPAAIGDQRVREAALELQDFAQVEMSLQEVGPEADGLAEGGDGLRQLLLLTENVAQVAVAISKKPSSVK